MMTKNQINEREQLEMYEFEETGYLDVASSLKEHLCSKRMFDLEVICYY